MRRFNSEMGLVLTMAVLFACMNSQLGMAQVAPAPAPVVDCNSALLDLLPCLEFLTNDSIPTVSTDCCGGLTNVSMGAPLCLCQFISPANANQSMALGINTTRSLELPSLCSLSVNPSSCGGLAGGPMMAPSPVPVLSLVPSSPAPISPEPVPALSPAPSTPAPISPEPASPPPSTVCDPVVIELAPCLSFLTGTPGLPLDACCIGLTDVVDTSTLCVCDLLTPGNGDSLPGINFTLAEELPSACNFSSGVLFCAATTPSVSPTPAPLALAPSLAPGPSPLSHEAPAPSPDCTSLLVAQLASCFPFITGSSSVPATQCCTNLGGVVQSSPACLCSLLNTGTGSISGVNITAALSLPSECGVPVSLDICLGGGSSAPPSAESPLPPTAGDSNDASVVAGRPFVIVALAVATICALLLQ